MIHHPSEAPVGLGSRVEGGFWVSRVWGKESTREREGETREKVRESTGESE